MTILSRRNAILKKKVISNQKAIQIRNIAMDRISKLMIKFTNKITRSNNTTTRTTTITKNTSSNSDGANDELYYKFLRVQSISKYIENNKQQKQQTPILPSINSILFNEINQIQQNVNKIQPFKLINMNEL